MKELTKEDRQQLKDTVANVYHTGGSKKSFKKSTRKSIIKTSCSTATRMEIDDASMRALELIDTLWKEVIMEDIE